MSTRTSSRTGARTETSTPARRLRRLWPALVAAGALVAAAPGSASADVTTYLSNPGAFVSPAIPNGPGGLSIRDNGNDDNIFAFSLESAVGKLTVQASPTPHDPSIGCTEPPQVGVNFFFRQLSQDLPARLQQCGPAGE